LRWKLLVIASLAAAVVGAVGGYAGAYAFLHIVQPHPPATFRLYLCGEAVPLVSSLLAGIFVYRHTARRRKLQVVVTVLLSIFLSQPLIGLLVAKFPFFHRYIF